MGKLQTWMQQAGQLDGDVARAIKISRSQVSRIRRGKTKCTYTTALKLEKLTGIRWFSFMARK